ncbi:hypothetical protein CAI21_04890 [Alkalilimnicola ehrlichii]|uniref:hypothetical protein n=1 Tax=Alkalilimnicola ehrlichii TaxID=351052 RepID=UPI000E2EB5A7|nr:hypothetical protein [Alkalilimnicola ehrlichii]RFA30416.1 hypothetical protein CAI21_04890 [Alkalilimnicola ehrlichii]
MWGSSSSSGGNAGYQALINQLTDVHNNGVVIDESNAAAVGFFVSELAFVGDDALPFTPFGATEQEYESDRRGERERNVYRRITEGSGFLALEDARSGRREVAYTGSFYARSLDETTSCENDVGSKTFSESENRYRVVYDNCLRYLDDFAGIEVREMADGFIEVNVDSGGVSRFSMDLTVVEEERVDGELVWWLRERDAGNAKLQEAGDRLDISDAQFLFEWEEFYEGETWSEQFAVADYKLSDDNGVISYSGRFGLWSDDAPFQGAIYSETDAVLDYSAACGEDLPCGDTLRVTGGGSVMIWDFGSVLGQVSVYLGGTLYDTYPDADAFDDWLTSGDWFY